MMKLYCASGPGGGFVTEEGEFDSVKDAVDFLNVGMEGCDPDELAGEGEWEDGEWVQEMYPGAKRVMSLKEEFDLVEF